MEAWVASANASAWATFLNATRTSRPSSWLVNQCGRGYEPTMVVGRMVSTILRIRIPPLLLATSHSERLSARGHALLMVGRSTMPAQQIRLGSSPVTNRDVDLGSTSALMPRPGERDLREAGDSARAVRATAGQQRRGARPPGGRR